MRRVADACTELHKLAFWMRDAVHGTRRPMAVRKITASVIGRILDIYQRHNGIILAALFSPVVRTKHKYDQAWLAS